MAFNPDKCLKFKNVSTSTCSISLNGYKFSQDGILWKNNTVTLTPGQTCYVKGTDFPGGATFSISNPVEIVSGNVMSLVDDGAGELTEVRDTGFRDLFINQSNLKAIPSGFLPATTIGISAYSSMFKGCDGLAFLPEGLLPATVLSESCYTQMFRGCSSLTEIPENFLPATTLARWCYYLMFRDCNGLTDLPKSLLPATTLADGCYRFMFYSCKGLQEIPIEILPAKALVSGCYESMFSGCSNLSKITVNFSRWVPKGGTDATKNWLQDVAAEGTFVCPRKLTEERGVSRIPEGWTIEYLPEPQRVATTFLKKAKLGGFK